MSAPASPPSPATPHAAALVALVRALGIVGLLLLGLTLTAGTAVLRAVGWPCTWWPALVAWWHRQACRVMGLELVVHGAPAATVLMVSNHVSWLDIPVLGSLAPVAFLSKSEVRGWPVVGWLAAQTGSLFIERGQHQAGTLAPRIGALIHAGRPVLVFPEGTTSTGQTLRRFHPRIFAAAQQPGIRVQPVALRYGSNAAPDLIPAFVGDDTLIASVWRVLRQPRPRVEVHFLPVTDTAGQDRRRLADGARAAIAGALGIVLNDIPAAAEALPFACSRTDRIAS